MAGDSRQVSGSVEVVNDSKSRVAYDLMMRIASHEKVDGEKGNRDYWLTLFVQCQKATSGLGIEYVLARK